MENPEEILHSLEEFSKSKPKDIPRELEEYLCFVAKTGNPVYQWPVVKSLFREKLLNVITEFYETCPSMDIPPCPNVEMFNYDIMKNFILEKLDTFAAAPFTVQRICELLTTPRKEYNRIDKYMRALEKNILVVSTTEPGRRSTENGEGIMNGIESEHLPESSNSSHDINVEEMDESPTWPRTTQVTPVLFENAENENQITTEIQQIPIQEAFENGAESKLEVPTSSTSITPQSNVPDQPETVITCRSIDDAPYVSIEPIPLNACVASHQETSDENQADSSVTITAVPAGVQRRRNSVERPESSESLLERDPLEIKTGIEEKPSSEKEEHATESKDEISSTCPEGSDPLAEAEPAISLEEKKLATQDGLGIENISPENSSSSPETLQIEVNSDQEKIQPEEVGKGEACPDKKEEIEEKELEEDKWVEDAKDPLLLDEDQEEAIPDQELDGIPLVEDQVEDVKEEEDIDGDKDTEEKVEERPAKPEKEEKTVPETEEAESKSSDENIPMEVDVVSDPEVKKPEQPAADEPTSTSDTVL